MFSCRVPATAGGKFMNNEEYVREVHDQGFRFDRRRLLGLLGGAGALAVAGGGALVGGGAEAAAAACATEVESETAGPFPADGSNGPDVRVLSGIVRSDIRSSFGASTTVAPGVPLQVRLTVSNPSCAPLAGAAVYAWHCDRAGRYSLYSSGATNQNYLRGVQVADANGKVTFTSIFPACYSGRWPHIHFEVYPSAAAATNVANKIATSQLALPKATCDLAYATSGYEASITNLSQISLATDNVFSDGASLELATITGSVASGFTSTLTVAVAG